MSAQAPTHSSNINQTAPKPVSQPKLELDIKSIGKYEVRPSILGDGGFCSVYACQCPSSESGTATVAVKLSTSPVHEFDNDKVSH